MLLRHLLLLLGKLSLNASQLSRRRLLAGLLLLSELAACQGNASQTETVAQAAPDSAAVARVRPLQFAPADVPPAFGPADSAALPGQAFHFMLADVTGDGRLDLVAPVPNQDSVMVLAGAGRGGWLAAHHSLTCKSPDAVAAADLNGDGRADIVLSTNEADKVAVLLSQPGGQFAPPAYYSAERSRAVALADVTSDGRRDIIVVGDENLQVLPGLGRGRFGPGLQTKLELSAYGLVVADVNGDHRPDVVIATGYSVAVLPGQGAGTFGAPVQYPAPDGAANLTVGDVNQDGRPDLVTANEKAASLSVWLGLGGGVFGGRQDYSAGPSPENVAMADVTGDGYPDLLTESYEDKAVLLLANQGDGHFGPPWASRLADGPRDIAVADVTGDGRADAVTVNQGYTVSVLPGLLRAGRVARIRPGANARNALSTRVAVTSIRPASGPPGTLLTLTGTNLNGATSVAFTGRTAAPQTTDLQVSSDGTTLTGLFVPEGAATGPLVVSTPAGPATSTGPLVVPPTLRMLSHQPTSFAKMVPVGLAQLTLEFDQAPTAASLANLVVTGSQYGGRHPLGPATVRGTTAVVPLRGRPFGPGERVRVSLPATVRAADGAAATPYVFEFTTAMAAGSGRFGPPTTYEVDRGPTSLAVADVTGDGRPDLLTVNEDESKHHDGGNDDPLGFGSILHALFRRKTKPTDVGSLTVWADQPDGRFGNRRNYPVDAFPQGLTLADLDGDGRLDILTEGGTTYGTSAPTTMLLSRANGFERPTIRFVPAGQPLGAVDADGDGLPDLFRADNQWQVYQPEAPRYGEPANDFVAGRRLNLSGYTTGLRLADFTGDGRLDIIETTEYSGPPTYGLDLTTILRPGLPGGRFGPALSSRPVRRRPALGDVTGDGYPDLVEADAHGVLMYPGNAAGFGPPLALSAAPAAEPLTPLLADMNGDGRLDLVAITYDGTNFGAPTGAVLVYRGQPGGRFARPDRYDLGDQAPNQVAVADVNGDGRLDIITVSRFASAVSVLLGQP